MSGHVPQSFIHLMWYSLHLNGGAAIFIHSLKEETEVQKC